MSNLYFRPSALVLGAALLLLSQFGCSGRDGVIRTLDRPEHALPADVEIVAGPIGRVGGVFIEASPSEPRTFNPLLIEDAGSSAALSKLTSGLTSWDPVKQEVVPGLAKRWDISEDNLTYTFHLRRGVKWSDGYPFTADDVIFTFQAIYDPRYPNRYSYEYSLEGEPFEVEKVDDYTVRFTTPDIFAPFLLRMGNFILPYHRLGEAYEDGTLMESWSLNTAIRNPEDLVSLGMFVLASYQVGERMTYEANPHYYRADEERTRLPYLDYYLSIFTGGDTNASNLLFARGQTDIQGISPGDVAWISRQAETRDFTIYDRGPSTTTQFIWFNLNPGVREDGTPIVDPVKRAWFEDVRFRQAVSYGINRDAMISAVFNGRATPLWGPESPANTLWYNPNVRQYHFNPERSRELLREAGFQWNRQGQLLDAEGNRVNFTLITNRENPQRERMATIFERNMQDLGIEVRLRFMDFNALVARLSDSFNYEACLLGLTGGGDPSGGMGIYHSAGRLHQWHPSQESPYRDWEAEIDYHMVGQLRTLDLEERQRHWFRVQEIMSEQVPYIYLVTPNTYVGIQNRWQNLDFPPLGSPIWNLDQLWTR